MSRDCEDERVRKWADDPTTCQREGVAAEQDKSIDQVMLGVIPGPELKMQAAKRLRISKPTLYDGGREAGLIDRN